MTIRAVVFDIGGVLEYTPELGTNARWERKLNLPPGEMEARLGGVWRDGSIGAIREIEVRRRTAEILGISVAEVDAMEADIWVEYLGTLNVELADYFRSLRPQYQTAILSNSFVGAREREQEQYGFAQMCDFIIYSHEVGMRKPDRQIFELTCERLGLPAEQVIFLDNVPANVAAACQVGMHGILFKENAQAIADIQGCIRANDGG